MAIPLTRWADGRLGELAASTGSAAIAKLRGRTLVGERAQINAFRIPGRRSAGGGSQLIAAQGGWVAINLSRSDDRDLLPALFETQMLDCNDLGEVVELAFARSASDLVARGREMGMAIAWDQEVPASPAMETLAETAIAPAQSDRPLVVDLSALWAGPLCGHLLHLAGAQVVKVESEKRPDAMRDGDPGLFHLLNGGKDNVAIDISSRDGLAALHSLLERADMVIEAARPRALRQLGIDADALVRTQPGKVWLTITGHGTRGAAADWIGFGDDCAVAGGLSSALFEASGAMGFVGDAIADPLTGITAAAAGWQAWRSGRGGRMVFSMSGIVRDAIAAERAADRNRFFRELNDWAAAHGRRFPAVGERVPAGPLRDIGADNAAWLPC
ncbi:CoA transferase [Novosphingobium sp. TH158]|nr:CoA transferase [Novosphingobium sp. TH158]